MVNMKVLVKKLLPLQYFFAARNLLGLLYSILYIGNRVYCPCCNHHFRCFLPFGSKCVRQNARCPYCRALERHRLLWLFLHDRTKLFSDRQKVLHFAPEEIFQKKLHTCINLDYTSADLNSPLAMVKMDITRIPYCDGTFDAILCSHVLEHITDDNKAMSELYRILKPGGWAILQVPIDLQRSETFEDPNVVDPKERLRVFGQSDHVRIYGRDYKNRLEHVGFLVQQEPYARELGPILAQRYGLQMDEDVFYCTKPI